MRSKPTSHYKPYYHTCKYCGANLDPSEHCDCEDYQEINPNNQLTTTNTNTANAKEENK